MKDSVSSRKQAFKDKDYRHGYVDEFLNARIATQIKVLREQRGWSQKELAEHAGMKQPRISIMESVNYSSWSITVLRKLAEAFDLVLCVSFESFGTRVNDIEELSRRNLERYSFDQDPVFQTREEATDITTDVTQYVLEPLKNVVLMGEYVMHKNDVSTSKCASVREAMVSDSTSVMTI